jgi:rhodanese-related sulfurtransferase
MMPLFSRRVLAFTAAALALLAAVAGSPYSANRGTIDVAVLARTIAREEEHVTALELAQWIRDRQPGLRVIDVRSASEFDAYHVPTAERVPLEEVVSTPFRGDETIVLYSEGGAHAAQAWVFLRALGHRRVFFLRGGLYEWLDDVINPTLPANATAERRSQFERAATLSRYFGGQPRLEESAVPTRALPSKGGKESTSAIVAGMRRRGC